MIRTTAFVLHVLMQVAPHYQPKEATAELLVELGRRRHFDPFTLMAIVKHESDWNSNAISKDGRDFGLSQVRSTNFKACREDRSSQGCKTIESMLLEWKFNLEFAAMLIEANREYCKRVVGTDLAVYWLNGFTGADSTHGRTCGHVRHGNKWLPAPTPRVVLDILSIRKRLEENARAWKGSGRK